MAELITQIKKIFFLFFCPVFNNITKNTINTVKVKSYNMNESKVGNRGTKSKVSFQLPRPNFNETFVKAQRVDGSYFRNNLKLRCTLMGCENSYQFKIPSNQLKPYGAKLFSTLKPEINPWFITGFSDAEGCFTIKVLSNAKLKTK